MVIYILLSLKNIINFHLIKYFFIQSRRKKVLIFYKIMSTFLLGGCIKNILLNENLLFLFNLIGYKLLFIYKLFKAYFFKN